MQPTGRLFLGAALLLAASPLVSCSRFHLHPHRVVEARAAATTTVSMLLGGGIFGTTAAPGYTTAIPLYGTVAAVATDETTFVVGCAASVKPTATDAPDAACGAFLGGGGITVVQGPSTFAHRYTQLQYEGGGSFTVFYTEHCKLLPSPTSAGGAADCTATVTQQMVNSAGSTLSDVQTASTLITDGLKSMEIPVTITAGVEKLAGGGATTTGTSPAATSSGAPAAPGEAKPNAGAKMGGRSWGASVAAAAVGVLLVAAA